MLPRRRDRSTVQNCLMMSFASGEMKGSAGKVIGFSTILLEEENVGKLH